MTENTTWRVPATKHKLVCRKSCEADTLHLSTSEGRRVLRGSGFFHSEMQEKSSK